MPIDFIDLFCFFPIRPCTSVLLTVSFRNFSLCNSVLGLQNRFNKLIIIINFIKYFCLINMILLFKF